MDPNLDPQLFQLMDIPFPIKAEPDEAQTGIATAVPDVSSWPHGDCWKSSRPIEPTFWAPNAKLCDCPEHSETTWPAEHAILVKLSSLCSFRTVQSDALTARGRLTSRQRLETQPRWCVDTYASIICVSYELTQGGRPTLEKNTEQA
ncbi:unnamed protein product [Penicillium discolor]